MSLIPRRVGDMCLLSPSEGRSRWWRTLATRSDGWRRTSSTTSGTDIQPHSCSRATFSRSCFSTSRPACQSMLSYSATTIASGQAKSTRHSCPHRSTISYCNSGSGNPPSMNASRASLSIGDSARPSACGSSSRTLTIPRRPFCCRIAVSSSAALQVPLRTAASSTAKARGPRKVRATSMAVHAGAVANRPGTRCNGAPVL